MVKIYADVPETPNSPESSGSTSTWAKSLLGAAIRVRGNSVGFLLVLAASGDIFLPEHGSRLQAFANLMALAEFKAGSARGSTNALCLTLGTGVGAGLISDLTGGHNLADDLGPASDALPAFAVREVAGRRPGSSG